MLYYIDSILIITTEGVSFRLSEHYESLIMPQDLYFTVLRHFVTRLPNNSIHSYISIPSSSTSQLFFPKAIFFDHITIDNNRFSSLTRSKNKAEALVAVQVLAAGKLWLGELEHIFLVDQPSVGRHQLGKVQWLSPAHVDLTGTVWRDL